MSDEIDTRSRILDAAEALFAERGFGGTSVRGITKSAGVNLAAVHYHFGSKEGVMREVLRRRVEPVNRERHRRLQEALHAAGLGPPRLEAIVEAFVEPAIRMAHGCADSVSIMRLLGRAHSEPGDVVYRILRELFGDTVQCFHAALARALPEFSAEEIYWKLHFMVGAMAFSLAAPKTIEQMSQGLCDPKDVDGLLARLIPFLAAGLSALRPIDAPGRVGSGT